MEILRWQAGNDLKNYQHIVCDSKNNAVVIDPLDGAKIRELLASQKLNLSAILITHEHADHVGDAKQLHKEFSAPVYTSVSNASLIDMPATRATEAQPIRLGRELRIQLHSTPGHSAGHSAFEIEGFLFSGDCLFHGGCGHCRLPGADITEHYRTVYERLAKLKSDLILMPGHYYAARNLDFCLHIEPTNERARNMRSRINSDADELNHQTTLRDEKSYNPFMRLETKSVRRRITELTGRQMAEASNLAVFTELRALRDKW